MAVERMDHVVDDDDLEAAIAFLLGSVLELEGEAAVEGRWVERGVGLDDVRVDIAPVRTPDGHSRLEARRGEATPACTALLLRRELRTHAGCRANWCSSPARIPIQRAMP